MGVLRTYWSSSEQELYIGSSTAEIFVKSEVTGAEKISLSSFLKSRCPSLFKPYSSAWWLNSGHLQTAYCVFGDFSKIDKVKYNRILLRYKDGGTVGLDFTPPSREREVPDDAPIVVVLHGLTGGSHESYVRAVLAQAVRPKEEGGLGYRGVVVNFRGCAGIPLTSGQFYSAGYTDDLRRACVYIQNRFPKARLLGVGFSLGANVMIRYIAEEGCNSRLRAGCALGCPWDIHNNAVRINASFFLRNVYSKSMGNNIVQLMKKHESTLAQMPENRITPIIPELFALKSPTLYDVDNCLTRRVGGASPPFPFESAEEYYRWGSSHHVLNDVRVPLLAINAADDPIVGHVPYDVGDNGHVALALTPGGGHLGWFEAAGGRWVVQPIIEWLRAVGEDLIPEHNDFVPIEEDDEGWIREVGNKGADLGLKVLGDMGIIEGVEGEGGTMQGL